MCCIRNSESLFNNNIITINNLSYIFWDLYVLFVSSLGEFSSQVPVFVEGV